MRAETVAEGVQGSARYLIGQDPFQIERHNHYMYETPFWRGGPGPRLDDRRHAERLGP